MAATIGPMRRLAGNPSRSNRAASTTDRMMSWCGCGYAEALTVLRDTRRLNEDPAIVASFQERQRLGGKPAWDVLETSYVG
jgi:hypothetical protein